MVENIDHNVGRVLNKLNELELEENTIIIYLSDNGPNGWRWNGGMRGRKGSTDEGGVRSPMYMKWKGFIPAGKKISQIAGAIDLLPTLTNLAGVDTPIKKPLDGKNLSPLIFEKDPSWNDRSIINYWSGKTSIRTQQYRLDHEGKLYDMEKDHGQTKDISVSFSLVADSLRSIKEQWVSELSPLTSETDNRPFTLGHPDYEYTQIPARDGIPHGNIERSNRHPNDTFFSNWKSANDSISWDVEVLQGGEFEVELYYTMKPENTGVAVQLSHGTSKLITRITDAHDPPLTGMENDRDPRIESYVKDFKPKILGNIKLRKGRNLLTLKIPHMDGNGGIDLRLLMFRRIK